MVELLTTCAILVTLTLLTIPSYSAITNKVRGVKGMEEIRSIEKAIYSYIIDHGGGQPPRLSDVGFGGILDPWGRLYVYTPNVGSSGRRGSIEALNDDFDLYSSGIDGATDTSGGLDDPVNYPQNQDDVVRANDGGWVGLGSEFRGL